MLGSLTSLICLFLSLLITKQPGYVVIIYLKFRLILHTKIELPLNDDASVLRSRPRAIEMIRDYREIKGSQTSDNR